MDVNFRISLRFHRYNHNSLVIVAMEIQRISHNMFMKVLCMMLSWVIVYAPWACKQLHACPSMRVATLCLLIMHEPPRQRCTTSRLLATFDRHTRVIVVEHYEARSAYHSLTCSLSSSSSVVIRRGWRQPDIFEFPRVGNSCSSQEYHGSDLYYRTMAARA